MSIGVPTIIVLEDNDEDFVSLELACQELDRPVHLKRYQRAEPLIEQIENESLETPALALIDLRMPGAGGMAALKSFKNNPRLRVTPCIVLSTSTNPKEVTNCYKQGATAFHEKLIETPRMIERLKTILRYWLDEANLSQTRRSESHA
ncbi:response regulator [Gimesia chilikensis]|uniref:response regulator n=1 Tax=Gimesia chilikensis TaxID=2605989 RepID=UPI003A91EF8C